MISAQIVVPEEWAGSRRSLEDHGVLDQLRTALDGMNPDWGSYRTQTVVLWTVQSEGTCVMMQSDCDPVPGVGEMVTLELEA